MSVPPCSYISVSVLLKRWLCAARALCWPLRRNASALRAPARASSELIHENGAESSSLQARADSGLTSLRRERLASISSIFDCPEK
jgi:hypothetical protein